MSDCEEQNRQLREENERITKERDELKEEVGDLKDANERLLDYELQQLREDHTALKLAWQNVNDENQQLREEQRILQIYFTREKDYRKEGQEIVTQLREELEQVKKERDGWKGEADYWQRKEREAHLLIQSLNSQLAAKDKEEQIHGTD